ncbi:hypothetical protein [Chitinivibrio alkaliphilus]|uniref:Uncharacterized protein n=1 Tax=Chitinivibrio alkaliphilus ACht1 TaxID=1313304 RepID=U7DC43_9BACT|nr:hypothetical protein [Chitinivibrio alkaliphilus]ERP31985.1 hypothetical protein CALK_0962 [Chitinivibrio alkaliphilus ACht1]
MWDNGVWILAFLLFASAYHGKLTKLTPNNSTEEEQSTFFASLHTGDLILCHGNSFFNKAVTLLTNGSPWGHIAMVVRTPTGKIFLWESNVKKDTIREVLGDTAKEGPMLTSAQTRLCTPNKQYALRRLTSPAARKK